MPELPEVETVVRDLRPRLTGRRIAAVEVGRKALRRRWSPLWNTRFIGRRIVEVTRRGKWIVLRCDDDTHLVIHLGMTGQLTVASADTPRATHTHLVLPVDDAVEELRFRDVRRFGSATLFADRAALLHSFEQSQLGPEPFDLDPKDWRLRLTATTRCLKAALLDQRLVAGVGNIYADESLHEARLPPLQRGRDTSPRQAERLRKAIVAVLTRAIEQRGSTIRDYIGGSGLKGQYQHEFRVYGRTGDPCARCSTVIERIRLAGRSTHYCPQCQADVQSPKSKVQSPKTMVLRISSG